VPRSTKALVRYVVMLETVVCRARGV